MALPSSWLLLLLLIILVAVFVQADDVKKEKPKKKKDIRDYNDADMARLLEQWEKDDDIEEGDLPEHMRKPAPVDFSKIDPSNPENFLKMSKKGRTLMVFVTVSGSPTEKETEEKTAEYFALKTEAHQKILDHLREAQVKYASSMNASQITFFKAPVYIILSRHI
ncbi:LRP chaperone MESD-like [Protopterus annectens]|uniref:LRP chaperone MESD-like n=1 Tax=Protopterus annectens TaxID=7888 RepID=UPI001CFAD5CA|nr:LRP chaperone MESD-like [Protopterus annectens]